MLVLRDLHLALDGRALSEGLGWAVRATVSAVALAVLLAACDTQGEPPPEVHFNASFQIDGTLWEGTGKSFRYDDYSTISMVIDRGRRQYFGSFNFDSLKAGTYDMAWTDPSRGAYDGFILSELVDDAVYGTFLLREGSTANRVVIEETSDGYAVQFDLSVGVVEPRDPFTLSGSLLPDSFSIRGGRIDLACGPQICE